MPVGLKSELESSILVSQGHGELREFDFRNLVCIGLVLAQIGLRVGEDSSRLFKWTTTKSM